MGMGWWRYIHAADERPRVTWPLVKRVLRYARPYRTRIILLLVSILITTGLGLLTPLILADLIDNTIPNQDVNRLLLLSLALLAVPLVSGAINVVQRWLNASIGEGVIYDLRVGLFTHLQRLSLRFFTNTKTGELMSRLNNDVVGAQNAVSNTIVNIITTIVQAAITFGVMLTLEWRLTLISVAIFPFFVLVAQRMGKRLRAIAREQMGLNAQMNAMMNETLNVGGALLVKLFGQASDEVRRFDERAVGVRNKGIQQAVIGRQFFVVVGLISALGTALTFGLGGFLVLSGEMTIGTIVALNVYVGQLYGALQALSTAPVDFATSMVSFERVFEVLDLPPDIEEKPDAHALSDRIDTVAFQNVSFRYDAIGGGLLTEVERVGRMDNVATALSGDEVSSNGAEGRSQAREWALKGVSFTARAGELVALVGPSGAGKTTLTYLMPRLYDPTEGRITVNGHDLRDVTLSSLMHHIGMVTQETHLFHDTIRTNLLYAKPDASQDEIELACQAANIHEFISGLPDGYDTVVGERGYRLSGGEKQRIALARVILKDPQVLILDEATSHLDSQSEALIQDALKTVMVGRTSIVIAHRLSTILSADTILVMDRGQIVERGTHSELVTQGGLYAHLYETQFKDEAGIPA
ncbi:MAG: ABC transporter ATP-binding protein [Chloroflexi bacterium]|nr:ABC transporter ATP-binding protein [Chloroflexota bacterium]